MITYYLAWDSGFKIQIEKYEKMNFKKKKTKLENQSMCPQ